MCFSRFTRPHPTLIWFSVPSGSRQQHQQYHRVRQQCRDCCCHAKGRLQDAAAFRLSSRRYGNQQRRRGSRRSGGERYANLPISEHCRQWRQNAGASGAGMLCYAIYYAISSAKLSAMVVPSLLGLLSTPSRSSRIAMRWPGFLRSDSRFSLPTLLTLRPLLPGNNTATNTFAMRGTQTSGEKTRRHISQCLGCENMATQQPAKRNVHKSSE